MGALRRSSSVFSYCKVIFESVLCFFLFAGVLSAEYGLVGCSAAEHRGR